MSQDDWTTEEFARLAALPEDAPERRALADDARFQARLLLLREFEAGAALPAGAADPRAAAAELTRRVLGGREPARPVGMRARIQPQSWRWALAAAAAVIVASGAWWFRGSHETGVVTRGSVTATPLDWAAVRENGEGVELAWTPVRGADHYRVVFYDPTQREIARVDSLEGSRLQLKRGALPPGLTPGVSVIAEVAAFRGADVLATSPPRAIRLR